MQAVANKYTHTHTHTHTHTGRADATPMRPAEHVCISVCVCVFGGEKEGTSRRRGALRCK